MNRTAWLQDRRMQKFRDVLSRWERGELSMMEAGELLGVSERQFRRYRDRYEEDGLAGTSQEAGKFLIGGCNAGSAIDDKEDESGAVDRDLRLLEDTDGNLTLFTGNDPAGIDDLVGAPVPTDGPIDSIARDSGLIADD